MNSFLTQQIEHNTSQKSGNMSRSPQPSSHAASTNSSESSGGFKSFWRKSSHNTQPQNVTFVQQDPSGKKKGSRMSRLLRGERSSLEGDGDDGGANSAQKRRQQVYSAQKRHRNRKAEYMHTLEQEVARLQHIDALINNEKNTLAVQNKEMRQLLASQSLDSYLDGLDLSSSSQSANDLSQLGTAAIDIRFDPVMGHERTFLDFADMDFSWTSDETTSGEEIDQKRQVRDNPVAGDSWAALDFILALEWPCKEHVHHASINPNTTVPEACSIGVLHGHALTATASVYHSALSPSPTNHEHEHAHDLTPGPHGLPPSSSEKWQLPHSEIDKLVELSELLELDDEALTPAQAYTAIRSNVPNENFLRPILDALKTPLASLVQCHGFGACMEAPMFWQHFDATIETLRFTRPELEVIV